MGDLVAPGSSDGQAGFGDAVAANFRLSPTQRIARRSGFIDNLGEAFSVMLPEWAGGITMEQADSALPSGVPEPFKLDDYIKRISPPAQETALHLLSTGRIDDTMTRSQVDTYLNDAMAVQADISAINEYSQTGGFIKSMGASLVGGATDPVYMIPIGGQAARGSMAAGSALRFFAVQGGKAFATGGAVALAGKKIVDESSYGMTDAPGISDELLTVGLGGGFAAVLPVGTYVAKNGLAATITSLGARGIRLPAGLPAWAQRWGTQAHLEEVFKKMNLAETPQLAQAASKEGADAALRPLGGTVRFDIEADRSIQILDTFIADARAGKFHEDLSLAPLMRGADDPNVLARLKTLRNLYKRHRARMRAAGSDPDLFRISVQRHLAQDAYDDLRTIRAFFGTDPNLKSVQMNWIAQLFLEVGDMSPTGNTPAARMSKAANLMYDLTRALSGSFADLTERDMKLLGGLRSSAEAIKDGLDLMLASYNREMLDVMKKHGLVGAIRKRFPEGDSALREAVNLIFDRQSGVHGAPVSPAATELADVMERYFKKINDELVAAGLFDANPFGMQHYVPLSIDEAKVSTNRDGFLAAAKAQFRFMDTVERPNQIRSDALARAFDRTTDQAIKDEIVAAVRTHIGDPTFAPKNGTEIRAALEAPGVSVLPPENAFPVLSRQAYRDSLEAIYEEGAQQLYSTISDPFAETKMFESIASAGNPDAFKRRTFTSVSPELRPFLIDDPVTLMRRYAAQVHGQIGIARSIQLHPDLFSRMVLTENGVSRPVTNAQDLLSWIGQAENAFNTFFGKLNVEGSDRARSALSSMLTDQRAIIKRLVGQTLYEGGARPSAPAMWATRQMARWSLVVNGGMMGVSNIADISGKLAWTVMHPIRGFPIMAEIFAPMLNRLRRRDLEFLHMASQLSLLPRELSEYAYDRRGFGNGMVRRVSGGIDAATEGAARTFSHMISMHWLNDMNGRWGSVIAMDEMVTLGKRLLIAIQSGARDPIKAAKFSPDELGRLSRLGIDKSNVKTVLEQIHRHGTHWDLSRANTMSFDEFLASDRPVNPMFEEWTGAKNERRAFMDNIANEARRVLNVTPGVADRPLIDDKYPFFRLVNQFSSYAFAYNRQRLRPTFQGSAKDQAAKFAMQMMFGWVMYATKNALSDRKSFSDSVAELVENPKAAAWGAAQDSMVIGNFMRTIGYYDRVAMPFGLSSSQAVGQTVAGGTFGAVQRQQQDRGMRASEVAMSFAGAGPQLGIKALDAINETNIARRDYMLAQVTPLQNFVWARVLNKAGISQIIKDRVGYVPGLVPSDVYRPQRPTLRAR